MDDVFSLGFGDARGDVELVLVFHEGEAVVDLVKASTQRPDGELLSADAGDNLVEAACKDGYGAGRRLLRKRFLPFALIFKGLWPVECRFVGLDRVVEVVLEDAGRARGIPLVVDGLYLVEDERFSCSR